MITSKEYKTRTTSATQVTSTDDEVYDPFVDEIIEAMSAVSPIHIKIISVPDEPIPLDRKKEFKKVMGSKPQQKPIKMRTSATRRR